MLSSFNYVALLTNTWTRLKKKKKSHRILCNDLYSHVANTLEALTQRVFRKKGREREKRQENKKEITR